MSKLSEKVLSLISDNKIEYNTIGNGNHTMSVEKIESEFGLLVAHELPNIEQYQYFYQNHNNNNTILCIKVSNDRLYATIGTMKDFEKRLLSLMDIG